MIVGRITSQMTSQMTLADLQQSMDRLDTTQEEMSTGKRINQPSDDPYGASLSIQLNGELSDLTSYTNNINDATGWEQASSSALGNIENMVQRVRELAVEAANGPNSASNDSDIAAEVNQLTDQIKQEANTQYAGQYLFAGTSTTTEPYQSSTGDAYQGNSSAVNRLIGPGATVQVNTDISQVLGSGQGAADGKLLDVLRNLSADMTSGNTSAISNTDLAALDQNISTLNSVQANVGAVQERLQLAASRISSLQLSDTKVLSSTQDADMAQVAIDYSNQQAAFSAALRASANIVQTSLLNFLQ